MLVCECMHPWIKKERNKNPNNSYFQYENDDFPFSSLYFLYFLNVLQTGYFLITIKKNDSVSKLPIHILKKSIRIPSSLNYSGIWCWTNSFFMGCVLLGLDFSLTLPHAPVSVLHAPGQKCASFSLPSILLLSTFCFCWGLMSQRHLLFIFSLPLSRSWPSKHTLFFFSPWNFQKPIFFLGSHASKRCGYQNFLINK